MLKMPKMLKTPKMPKMLNNKINKNRGIYIVNGGLELIFLQAIALQAYLYIKYIGICLQDYI